MAFFDEPQWFITCDSYPVGCLPQDSILFRSWSFDENPDLKDPRYNTLNGMYKEHCGIDNLHLTWTHDEYLYQLLKHNKSTLPEEALVMIRYRNFQSFNKIRHCSNNHLKKQSFDFVLVKNQFNRTTS